MDPDEESEDYDDYDTVDIYVAIDVYGANVGRIELWNADPLCNHVIDYPPGGGIKCTKCRGWFCF